MSSRHYTVTLTILLLLFSHLMLAVASWDGYDCYFPLERGLKIKQNFLEWGAGPKVMDTRMGKARIRSDPWLPFPSQTLPSRCLFHQAPGSAAEVAFLVSLRVTHTPPPLPAQPGPIWALLKPTFSGSVPASWPQLTAEKRSGGGGLAVGLAAPGMVWGMAASRTWGKLASRSQQRGKG